MLKFLLQRKQKDKLNVLYGYTAIYMSRISMPASQQATSTCVQMQSIPLATASNSQQGKGILRPPMSSEKQASVKAQQIDAVSSFSNRNPTL